MIPREHGAYGQLLFPLATALALGRPTWTALAIAAGAVAVFLLHEQMLMLAGGRALVSRVTRIKHSIPAEIAAALVLASAAWPVARASGISVFAATACLAAFGASFVVGTVCVHAVIAATRKPPAAVFRAAAFATAVATWAGLTFAARAGAVSVAAAWAAIPTCVAGCLLVAWPPSVRRLRVVGWTLVATTALACLVLIAVLG